jgi:hypothetical protein
MQKHEKIEKVTGSRDDKGEGDGSIKSGCWTEVFFIILGGLQAQGTPVYTHCETRLAMKRV